MVSLLPRRLYTVHVQSRMIVRQSKGTEWNLPLGGDTQVFSPGSRSLLGGTPSEAGSFTSR